MATKRSSCPIISEPRGPSYEALIRYCFAKGETGTLADLFPKSSAGKQARAIFLGVAAPYLISTDMTGNWPVGDPQTGDPRKPTPLWRFTLNRPVFDLILNAPSGLYGWKSPKLPEDLAIYRLDGTVLLGSVAHEHIGWMNLSNEEMIDIRLGLVELQIPRI